MRANISGAGKGSGRRPTLANNQRNTLVHPLNFGNMVWAPELVLTAIISSGNTESSTHWLYKFRNFSMAGDEVDKKTGKVKKYQEIYVVSTSVESARVKGKVTEDWVFISTSPLGKDWR